MNQKIIAISTIIGLILLIGVTSNAQSAVDERQYVYNGTAWIPWLATPDGAPKVDLNLINITTTFVITENLDVNQADITNLIVRNITGSANVTFFLGNQNMEIGRASCRERV